MTFNTGNPIGSTDARDLSDNAENFDKALGTTAATWVDRFGVTRDSFEGRLAKGSFYRVGTFAEGYTLTNMRQTLEYSGHEYSWAGTFPKVVAAGATPATSGGIGAGAWVDRTDVTLRGELKQSIISETLAGLYGLTNFVTPIEYGAIGDGAYHALSETYSTLTAAQMVYPFVTSLTQSIDWAACQTAVNTNKQVYTGSYKYVLTDSLVIPRGGSLIGAGVDRWIPGYADFIEDDVGTHFLMYGTGSRTYAVKHISNCVYSGGVVTNPSASDTYTTRAPSPSFDLIDFTNQDASATTAATSKAFSAGIACLDGSCTLRDFRVVPYYNKQEGYKSEDNNGLGAEWDVGILLLNSAHSMLQNVQSVGYWRIASLAKLSSNEGTLTETLVGSESDSFIRCMFQGYIGYLARTYDVHKVVAYNSTSISIPFNPSHQFAAAGSVRCAGADFVYTTLTYSSGLLVFGGISSVSGISVGSELRQAGNNFGMSGTTFVDCYIASLNHHSRLLATSVDLETPFNRASECIQISGDPLRAQTFIGCTVIGRDDVMYHLHKCGDVHFNETYFEGQNARDTLNGTLGAIGRGARFIASDSSLSGLTYAAGNTIYLRHTACTYGYINNLPKFENTATRYTTTTGVFYPREVRDDHYQAPEHTTETRVVSKVGDVRLIPTTGGMVYLGAGDGDANVQSTAGSLNLMSGLRVRLGSSTIGSWWWYGDSDRFSPVTANTMYIASATYPLAGGYTQTAFTVTSDATKKQDITRYSDSTFDSVLLDVADEIQGCYFRFIDRVAEKGDSARYHIGVIAQDIKAIFESHNIDPFKYSILSYDEWDAKDAVYSDDGSLIDEAVEAGSIYRVNYEELCMLLAMASKRKFTQIESRLAALEAK